MPTLAVVSGGANPVNLSSGQTGNGASTNVAQRRSDTVGRAAMLRLVTTIGATPTCTYLVEGSGDGTAWWPLRTADVAAAGTLVAVTFTITTAATFWRVLPIDEPWNFLRLTYSANTNVTNTADLWAW